jgi:cob(I)alamin adenosyltransferase
VYAHSTFPPDAGKVSASTTLTSIAMGHRLSKIYTRTGDDGTTGLGDGTRVEKTHARIEAYGTVDEANSAIGMILAVPNLPAEVAAALTRIQHELFDLGGELAVPGYRVITSAHIDALEDTLEKFNEPLPPLKEFILPGGGPAAAACHLARAITRRAERCSWAASKQEDIAPEVTRYLNRLSDLLFVIARVLARHENGQEVLWKKTVPVSSKPAR